MAKNKVTQAKAESKRPWYTKKRIMIPLVLVALLVFASLGGANSDEKKASNTANEHTTKSTEASTEEESSAPEETKDEGPQLTPGQQQAVRSAKSYISLSGFSRQGLIDQLSSEYGDKYPVDDATVAVDSLNTDYNEQAARSAKSYLSISGFSCQGLIDQLSSDHGDKYTVEQAQAGAEAAGAC